MGNLQRVFSMNTGEVRSIIEATLKSGIKTPGMLELTSKLDSCTSIDDVIAVVKEDRSLILKELGLNEDEFDHPS
jgi:hypothetical protein